MSSMDPRIDTYIAKSAEFAQPILEHLRDLVHKTCHDAQETMKWSFPHFEYNGAILCSMASFKHHCSFGFWLGSLMNDPQGILTPVGERSGMGHFGKIESIKNLPSDKIMSAYIKEAMKLIEVGVKLPKKEKAVSVDVVVPDALAAAFQKNKKAKSTFENFSPSHRKEYVMWINEAKTDATRDKRIATTIEWLTEGKARNWKYEKC